MADAQQHFAEILERVRNPAPLESDLADLLERGKAEQLLSGHDATGHPFAPLAPSTLKRRPGTGPPLAPRGASSAIITQYVVTVSAAAGRLIASAGWPSLSWVRYHITGGPRLPQRNPSGFRDQDKAAALTTFKEWLIRG
jgi:hypothetical protein